MSRRDNFVTPPDTQFVCTTYVQTGSCPRSDLCEKMHVGDIQGHIGLRNRQIAAGTKAAQRQVCPQGRSCTTHIRDCIFVHQRDAREPKRNREPRPPINPSERLRAWPPVFSSSVRELPAEPQPPHSLREIKTEVVDVAEEIPQVSAKDDEKLLRNAAWESLARNTLLPELPVTVITLDDIYYNPTVTDILRLVADPDTSVGRMEELQSLHKSTYLDALNNGFEGWPMPFYAIKHGREDLLTYFLRSGASPDMVGGPGLPLVIFALLNDYHDDGIDTARLILSLHAKTDALPSPFFTPFVTPVGLALDVDETTLPLWLAGARDLWEKKLKQKFYLLGRYYFHAAATQVVLTRVQQISPLLGHSALFGASFLVVGQKIATNALRHAFLTHATGTDQNLPLVLLLAGPCGHGKTKLAQNLASMMNIESQFIRMSEMAYGTDLFGAKSVAGWKGSEIGSDLEKFLVDHHGKKGVVVLDEMEKVGDAKVLDSLLSVWEDGIYVSRRTETQIDSSKIIWICTTNGADPFIKKFCETGAYVDAFESGNVKASIVAELERGTSKALKAVFSRPVLGRIHRVIPFTLFSLDERAVVVSDLALSHRRRVGRPVVLEGPKLNAFGGCELDFIKQEVAICREIADDYDSDQGARSLKRATKNELENKHADTYFASQELIVEGPVRQVYRVKHSEKTGIRVFFVRDGEKDEEDEEDE